MKQSYSGGCQCGRVKYQIMAEIDEIMACNCSRCGKLGSLFAFVPLSDFTLQSGKDAVTDFQFNKHAIHHFFCATCGIESYAIGKRRDGTEMAGINVRCLEGIELDKLKIKQIDGRNMP